MRTYIAHLLPNAESDVAEALGYGLNVDSNVKHFTYIVEWIAIVPYFDPKVFVR